MPESPLDGLRIIDLSMFWAGPFATEYLADMGAEVIKVESIQRIDGHRNFMQLRPEDPAGYERSVPFHGANRNKLGVTIDLTRPAGATLFKDLVSRSDVVLENFSPRVMRNFGLDYPVLKQVNPSLIMVSMSGYGANGPWRDHSAFAVPLDQVSGRTYLTGYHDGGPLLLGIGILADDPMAGLQAAFAVQAALAYRRATGKGQHIDLSEAESLICLLGHEIAGRQLDGCEPQRLGNRDASAAPQGCYRCSGEDKWVAITVATDDEWAGFKAAIGNPAWADRSQFSDVLGRRRNHDELDRCIERWTSRHDHREVMRVLQQAGVACGAVLNAPELLEDPHLEERAFFAEATRDDVGTHRYPGMLCKLSKTPGRIRQAAPRLGEHNDYVFGQLLGLSAEKISALAEDQIIGTRLVTSTGCVMA